MEKNKTLLIGGIAVFVLVSAVFAFLLWNANQKRLNPQNMTQRTDTEEKAIGAEPQIPTEPVVEVEMKADTGDAVIDAEITKLNSDLNSLGTDNLDLSDF